MSFNKTRERCSCSDWPDPDAFRSTESAFSTSMQAAMVKQYRAHRLDYKERSVSKQRCNLVLKEAATHLLWVYCLFHRICVHTVHHATSYFLLARPDNQQKTSYKRVVGTFFSVSKTQNWTAWQDKVKSCTTWSAKTQLIITQLDMPKIQLATRTNCKTFTAWYYFWTFTQLRLYFFFRRTMPTAVQHTDFGATEHRETCTHQIPNMRKWCKELEDWFTIDAEGTYHQDISSCQGKNEISLRTMSTRLPHYNQLSISTALYDYWLHHMARRTPTLE